MVYIQYLINFNEIVFILVIILNQKRSSKFMSEWVYLWVTKNLKDCAVIFRKLTVKIYRPFFEPYINDQILIYVQKQ